MGLIFTFSWSNGLIRMGFLSVIGHFGPMDCKDLLGSVLLLTLGNRIGPSPLVTYRLEGQYQVKEHIQREEALEFRFSRRKFNYN